MINRHIEGDLYVVATEIFKILKGTILGKIRGFQRIFGKNDSIYTIKYSF